MRDHLLALCTQKKTDLVKIKKTDAEATCNPGQILLPKPKGKLKFMKRGSSVRRKRSGLKTSGSGNISGSRKIVLNTLSAFTCMRNTYSTWTY